MRPEFFKELQRLMTEDNRIYAITGDLGYGGFDRIREELPSRFFNVGAREQAMLDIAVGMATFSLIPVVYSITPFLLYRGFETLRTYINHEVIPVKLVGSGRGKDYTHDGFSHDASDDLEIIKCLPSIRVFRPQNASDVRSMMRQFLYNRKPSYMNLAR